MRDRMPPLASSSRPVRVLKFGGTSLDTADHLSNAVAVVGEVADVCRPVVVVSAAAGVTDDLIRAADDTRADRATAEAWTRHIGRRYRTLAVATLEDECLRTRYETALRAHLSDLRRALQVGEGPDVAAARDTVLAAGERLMAPLMAAALAQCGWPAKSTDASRLIRTDASHGNASVKWETTQKQIRRWAQGATGVPVITGFVGGTEDGRTTTLGRGGSDYSAALVARALDADRLERWTDVDGLYTRDPEFHEDARRLDRLDFDQARTWTKAGRLGMHPRILDPLAAADIPVHVRCTHRPAASGTRIVPSSQAVRC